MAPPRASQVSGRRAPGRPRAGDSQATRLQILDAAITEFAQNGFGGSSTRAIVERAGVTSATLYHHFGSKRGAYVDTYRYALKLITDRYEVAVAGCTDLRSELKAIIRCAEEIMTTRYEITTLVMRAQTELTASELTENSYPEPARGFVGRMTQRAVERGDLVHDDAPSVELLIPSLLWGFSIVGRTDEGRAKLVLALDRLIDGLLFQPHRAAAPERA